MTCQQGDKLFCLSRRSFVKATPEEAVRQEFLAWVCGPFGCQRHLVAVEVPLRTICPRQPPPPRRRLDVVCFHLQEGQLRPLLLVECKASRPVPTAVLQLEGYNFYVHAPFSALVWPGHIFLCHKGAVSYEGPLASMPSFRSLIRA